MEARVFIPLATLLAAAGLPSGDGDDSRASPMIRGDLALHARALQRAFQTVMPTGSFGDGSAARGDKIAEKLSDKAQAKGIDREALRVCNPQESPEFIREDVYVVMPGGSGRGPRDFGSQVGIKLRRDDADDPLALEIKYAVPSKGSNGEKPPVFVKQSVAASTLMAAGDGAGPRTLPFAAIIDWSCSWLNRGGLPEAAAALAAAAASTDVRPQPIDVHGIRLDGVTLPLALVSKARVRKWEHLVKGEKSAEAHIEATVVRTAVVPTVPAATDSDGAGPPAAPAVRASCHLSLCFEASATSKAARYIQMLYRSWIAGGSTGFVVDGYPGFVAGLAQQPSSVRSGGGEERDVPQEARSESRSSSL